MPNRFITPKIKYLGFCITYDSQDVHYIIHTRDEKVQFKRDDTDIPYINYNKPHDMDFVQTHKKKGFNKKVTTNDNFASLIPGNDFPSIWERLQING